MIDYNPFLDQLPPSCPYCVYDRLQSCSVSTPSWLCVLSKWLITIPFYSNSLQAIEKHLENYKRFRTSKLIKKDDVSLLTGTYWVQVSNLVLLFLWYSPRLSVWSSSCVLIKTTLLLLIRELHIWRSKHFWMSFLFLSGTPCLYYIRYNHLI